MLRFMKRLLVIAAMLAAAPAVAQPYPDYGRPSYGGRHDQDAARSALTMQEGGECREIEEGILKLNDERIESSAIDLRL